MQKHTEIEIDASTWNGSPPSAFKRLPATWKFDLRLALAYLAIHTRPPGLYGFDLSDTWAILRYGYAFSPGVKLQLKPEWNDTDPHQKTILSDDLGVALTTYLLIDKLGAIDFYDCQYFLKYFSGNIRISGKRRKNGKDKTPDFVFTDGRGQLSIVECKGTQSSHYQLKKAMDRGVLQKNNITSGSRTIKHSLIMGAYLPQHGSKENAMLQIKDPDWGSYAEFLSNVDRVELKTAMVKYEFSRDLALLGLPITSRIFSSQHKHFDPRSDIRSYKEIADALANSDIIKMRASHDITGDKGNNTSMSIEVSDEGGLIDKVSAITEMGIDYVIKKELDNRDSRRWKSDVTEEYAEVVAPTGIAIKIMSVE